MTEQEAHVHARAAVHAGGHAAGPRLEIQFEDLEKQAHAARFGMWVFLGSELLLFAGLFGLYAAYRVQYPAAFAEGVHHNSLAIGTINTVVLIASSFTVAWSIHAVRRDQRKVALGMLAATMALGALFLVLKGVEYTGHFEEGIYPGRYYAAADPALLGRGPQVFFTMYYFMTGLHALHMVGGLAVMAWLTVRVARRRTTAAHHTALELGALYWHLVDGIWIFLWPLFYLTG
jgi:cytochrome c oxidase subunit III